MQPATTLLDQQALDQLRDSANQASQLMKLMANPDRLLLLCQLSQREQSVSELEQSTDIRQPTLSQQLTVLRKANLVVTRREGKNIIYAISSPAALAVMQVLYREICQKDQ